MVWNNKSRPIQALIYDDDNSTAYVFGKDFYFELTENIKRKQCRDITVSKRKIGEPIRTVLECAKVLHENGELKLKKPTTATEKQE